MNMTLEYGVVTRLQTEIQDLRKLVYIITQVLAVSIFLLFILLLVLAWRFKRERRKTAPKNTQQIFMNKAYRPDEESNNRTINMQYIYAQDMVKVPIDSGNGFNPVGRHHNSEFSP